MKLMKDTFLLLSAKLNCFNRSTFNIYPVDHILKKVLQFIERNVFYTVREINIRKMI